jgi:hypothetical protein
MWEVVVFFQKTASVLIPIYSSDSAVQQSILTRFVSMLYLFVILKYSPFANNLMNSIEKLSNINLFLMYFSALLFIADIDGEPIIHGYSKDAVGVVLCVLAVLSIVSAACCVW